jgi:hypothetical protein
MAKKYKISEGFVKTFLGLFGNKQKPKDIADLIDNDPRLKQLDKKIGDLNRAAADDIRSNPKMLQLFKKWGIEITGGY